MSGPLSIWERGGSIGGVYLVAVATRKFFLRRGAENLRLHNEQTATAKTTLKFFPPPFSRDGRGGNSSQFRGFQKEEGGGGNKYRSLPSPPRHFGSSLHFPILFFPVSKTICDTAPRYFSHIKLQRIQSFFLFRNEPNFAIRPGTSISLSLYTTLSFLFFSRFYFLFSTEEKKKRHFPSSSSSFSFPPRQREKYIDKSYHRFTQYANGGGVGVGGGERLFSNVVDVILIFAGNLVGGCFRKKKRAAQK